MAQVLPLDGFLPVVLAGLLLFFVVFICSLHNDMPKHLPWAEAAVSPGPVKRARLYLRSILSSHDMLQRGYNEYSKRGVAFVFANLFTGAEILLPIQHMDWIHDQPESVLSSFEAHREFMRADWTFLHPTIFKEHVFANAIKMQLTRHLDVLTPEMADEAEQALDGMQTRLGEGWFELSDHGSWKKVVLQVVSRIYVGLPLCRDLQYLHDATTFNEFSMLTAAIIGMFPSFLRPVLAPVVVFRDRWYHEKCAAKTKPIIKERLDQILRSRGGEDSKIPNNLITWSIEDALDSGEEGKHKQSLDFLAARISMMNFVSIDSTSITVENVLWDVLSHPHDIPTNFKLPPHTPEPTLLDYLRAEARQAYGEHQGGASEWKDIINSVPLLDACLKESFRLNNFISRTNVRQVMAPEGIEVPGVGRVKKGVNIAFSLWGSHHDEEAYQDAFQWRMLRWLECEKKQNTSVFGQGGVGYGNQYLPFGYRRHACPGRFFAMRIVKLLVIRLLLSYDMEKLSENKPVNPWLGVSRGPPMGGKLRFHRRVVPS